MSLDFELIHDDVKTRRAVLLFHGMTGSPFELKKYGQYLYGLGYDVYADCLPGHGDKVEDIYTVKYQDWLEFSYQKFEELDSKYDEVFLSGLCLGAVLAIAVAQKYPDRVRGVVALSTTLFLDGWRLPWYSFLLPLGLSTLLRFYYTYPECDPHGIKNLRTRNIVKKLLQKGDVGMNDFPMTCIYELFKLSRFVRNKKLMKKVIAPFLFIHSQEDDLTSPKGSKVVYDAISSEYKTMIVLNDSYHMVLYDNEKDYVFETAGNFLNSHSGIKECVAC
ncbi:MAG: alpha/beta fold hydrolase [Candidatus Gastranaerophilales bacterium]|nr:alpha/beta fold hydrolase [Candidatus Gastranaerophilales bacterium]